MDISTSHGYFLAKPKEACVGYQVRVAIFHLPPDQAQ
jgi:hypothetical protein